MNFFSGFQICFLYGSASNRRPYSGCQKNVPEFERFFLQPHTLLCRVSLIRNKIMKSGITQTVGFLLQVLMKSVTRYASALPTFTSSVLPGMGAPSGRCRYAACNLDAISQIKNLASSTLRPLGVIELVGMSTILSRSNSIPTGRLEFRKKSTALLI